MAFGVLVFVVLLLFAIFFHELGHYLTARWSGIKITAFFIGFGPTLWSRRAGRTEVYEDAEGNLLERPETEYGVKLLPLGGFVKIIGMSPFEDIPPEDYPRSFQAASFAKRALVLVAGSLTHAITAFVVLFLLFSVIGLPDSERPTTQIEAVTATIDGKPSPAVKAGVRPGDKVVSVNGKSATNWDAVRNLVRDRSGQPTSITIERDGKTLTKTITPIPVEQEGKTYGVVGISPKLAVTRIGPVAGFTRTGSVIGNTLVLAVKATPKAFSPKNLGLVPGEKASNTERPISIYGAGKIAAGLFSSGQIATFLYFFASINLFIGLFNLLPLPPLDGGHLLLLGIEKIRRRPLGQKALLRVMAFGFILILSFGMWVLFRDIVSPVVSPFG